MPRSKFHGHQASWGPTLHFHTCSAAFGESKPFRLGRHRRQIQATGLAAAAAGVGGKSGFKSTAYPVMCRQVIKVIGGFSFLISEDNEKNI